MKTDKIPATQVFYFSSTGNSLIVARTLAEKLGNTEILSIPAIVNTEIDFSADRIIVVFPVYMWGLPNIVRQFFERINQPGHTPVYTVATIGGIAGDPHRMVDIILRRKNIGLASGFLVWMPENFTARYDTWPKWLERFVLRLSKRKISKIAEKIQNNRKGIRETTFWGINWFLTMLHHYLMNKIFVEKSLRAKDYFWISNKCNGCAICAKVCPVGNIELNGNKPVWGDHCEICVACLQWCPQRAVQFGKSTIKRGRYHHPDVTVKDFIMR